MANINFTEPATVKLGFHLEKSMALARSHGMAELVFFINAGDPNLDVTYQMLKTLKNHELLAVELCVPFPNSLTDGPVIRESHHRALRNDTNLDDVLKLAYKAQKELGLSIVLLADYSYTVKPLGMDVFLQKCVSANVSATLIHCLPPKLRESYVRLSKQLNVGRIMSFFIGSDPETRYTAYQETEGYIYVVSRFGRTGNRINFEADVRKQLTAIRSETDKPLAVGFGVKTQEDIALLVNNGADAVIIGSAATAVVEKNLTAPERIAIEFDFLVREFSSARKLEQNLCI